MVTLDVHRIEDDEFFIEAPDTPFCMSQQNFIGVQGIPRNAQVLWSNGDRGRETRVTREGWYWVEYGYFCPEKRDSVYVEFDECEAKLFIPDAFVPNGNGRNDFFHVQGVNIGKYEIWIYNRWGQEIYYSNDINKPWDGSFNGVQSQIGGYVYVVRWASIYNLNEDKVERGNVRLIR